MSQHDLDLANQAGAAFRADLNNALQALASQNAGTSAPGTTYAHMWWMDTANGILKQRNAANDAWISVARIINGRWYPVEGEYLASSPYCTDTGAADAYVLATDHAGSAPTAYRNGDQYRFRAGASNTGASTVNINGLGAKTLVTVTGVPLPAGYIRTDVDTTITYDAANDWFVADREVERGSNANGEYSREADGRWESYVAASLGATPDSHILEYVWTLPSAFNDAKPAAVLVSFGSVLASRDSGTLSATFVDGSSVRATRATNSGGDISSSAGQGIYLEATGYWY